MEAIMNNNFNLNELIANLNDMLNRENNLYNTINVPVNEEQQKIFSAGYAEGIADVLRILTETAVPA